MSKFGIDATKQSRALSAETERLVSVLEAAGVIVIAVYHVGNEVEFLSCGRGEFPDTPDYVLRKVAASLEGHFDERPPSNPN